MADMVSSMKKLILLSVLALWGTVAFAQTRIKVDAPNMVSADEQFNVTFIIEGDERPSSFSWETGSDFSLVWGPQKGESTSISIVNGKRTKSSQYTFTYIVSPKSTGRFDLPAASAKIKGETVYSSTFPVEVLAASSNSASSASSSQSGSSSSGTRAASSNVSSEDIFLRFSLSKTSAVIGEPLTAELKLYQRVDIAGFEGAKFPSFNGFWSQETAAPSNIEFHREEVNGQLYNAALLRRYVLIPQQAGDLTIDPAELSCLVNIRTASRSTNSIFDSFFDTGTTTVRKRLTTPAVHVHVRNLPSGAPASFGGGVGNFRISARLSNDKLKTHEATSLIVTVSGKGNVSLLEPPVVKFPADMEVYDTKSSENTDKSAGGTSGSKTFEYPFIPRSYGEFTIEPVEYSYYDINTGKYQTISTEPIVFEVEKGTASESSDNHSSGLTITDRKDVKTLGEDIRFISAKTPSYKFSNKFFAGSLSYWITVAVLLLLAFCVWYALKGLADRKADVVGSRNRKATKMALGRLRLADDYLKKNLYSAFYEELHKALLGYVSDKLNISVEDLNKDNISAQLQQREVPQELVELYVSLIDACEFARYSPDAGNDAMTSHYNDAVKAISSIDSAMKGHTKNVRAGGAAMIIALMLALPGISNANDNSYLDSLWQKGVSAYSQGYWEESISSWKSMNQAGVVSTELYYNLGNAYFKSGDCAHAVLYYERALKADPSYSDARYNLEYANAQLRDKIDAVPEFVLKSWMRKLSYLLGSNDWAVLSLVLFAVALTLLLMFLRGNSSGFKRFGFYGAIVVFLLSVNAFGLALWQKSVFMTRDQAIVMAPVSSVKSSPSTESSKDLFVLHEGTKLTISDDLGDWCNIELSDGRQGWIKKSDIEVI